MNLPSSNTKPGQKQTHGHFDAKHHHLLHKIPSLPIFRKNLLNSSRLRQRIQIDGDKFFAKLPAAGPETSKIIHVIRRSRSVKWVKKFEFDPYLCDHSHLNDLRKICYKLRDIPWLNFVIRRVDFPHELETITPFISRFSRLRSLRVEFPRTENIHENGFIQLFQAIESCSHLRSLEWKGIEMAARSPISSLAAYNAYLSLKWLTHFKMYETSKKGALLRHNMTDSDKPEKALKRLKVRKMRKRVTNEGQTRDITLSSAGEWANREVQEMMDRGKRMELIKMGAQMLLGIEKVRFLRMKALTNFEEIVNFFTFASFLTTLSHLEVQSLNCQLSDLEVFAIADGLSKVRHLKYFSLKVFQKPGLSEECIEQLARVLAKLDNLLNFDVYFRRLGMHPQGIKDLGNRIQSFGDIECSCSKESIHIFRRKIFE